MLTEDYVDFETAKLLKDKGFDEPCRVFYKDPQAGLYEFKNAPKAYKDKLFEPCFLAPSQSTAMKWLREEKHYYIQIMLDSWALGGHSGYYIVIQDVNSDFSELSPTEQVFFETYEDAVEAALKYSLENLI